MTHEKEIVDLLRLKAPEMESELMPNPETGTVGDDPGAAANAVKGGRIEDRGGWIYVPYSKVSVNETQLAQGDSNTRNRERPPSAKDTVGASMIGEQAQEYQAVGPMALFELIEKGLPAEALYQVAQAGHWVASDLVPLLNISTKTFRRYEKDHSRFSPIVSARIVDLAKVVTAGRETFDGDMELFNEWLTTPCMALARRKPMALLSNSAGVEMVVAELARIEWGVYA